MLMPSITAGCFAILTCAALTLHRISSEQPHTFFNGGILLTIGLVIPSALPILSRLSCAELANEACDQAAAALHLLEVAYVIFTI